MLGRENSITVEEAIGIVFSNLPEKEPLTAVIDIDESLGRICSQNIIAAEDLPSFARSTVDGCAVRAEDTFSATETMPAYLNLSEEIFMGREACFVLPKGTASKIPTGGMLPRGADAVVMFEHVQSVDETMIEVLKPVGPGENVIQRGEDLKNGDVVLNKGHRMRPQDIGACAGIGITKIIVYERPVVSIISTGDEIVPAAAAPGTGQVRDINSYLLKGMITETGCRPVRKGIFKDNYDDIRTVIEKSVHDSDMILVSGGTSVGTKDMIARIISDMGDPGVLFHGVSIKPGKPLIGGIIQGIPIFGLPGHPAAVSICFEIFILPLLDRLSGLCGKFPERRRPVLDARISRNISSTQGREEHIRVILEKRDDGLWAVPVNSKSGLISTLVKADGAIIIPLHRNGIEKGETVAVRLFT